MFAVQWDQVRLSGMESKGAFTFQVVLHKSGNITFSYQEVGPAYACSLQMISLTLMSALHSFSCRDHFLFTPCKSDSPAAKHDHFSQSPG